MPSVYNTAKRDLIDVAVDWITATADGKSRYKKQSAVAERLLRQEAERGNKVRRVTIEGYAGFASGQVFAGALGHTMLMRLSGALAAGHWQEVYEHSTNVSRLDLQATVRYTPEVPRLHQRVERDVLKMLGQSKKPLDVGIRQSRRRGATCEIGSRQSDRYARVYDKARESKLEQYQGCWRWEVEYKRANAARLAARIFESERPESTINGELLQTFRSYGTSRLWATEARPSCVSREPSRPEVVCSLLWLRNGVSKRVQWLMSMGKTQEVIDALGLSDAVTINPPKHEEE